jgi:hypothetical protein
MLAGRPTEEPSLSDLVVTLLLLVAFAAVIGVLRLLNTRR